MYTTLPLRAAVALFCVLLVPTVSFGAPGADSGARQRIFGVTVDDVSRLPALLDSLRVLPRRPWVRVVFDVDPSRPADPRPYLHSVRQLATVGPVVGELVDSSDLDRLTVEQVKVRAAAYVRALRPSVAVWEIGNEVNGDWTGAPALVARTVQIGADTVHRFGGRTALTLYENEGCGDGRGELSPTVWSGRFLSPRLRAGLAYVLLSYYEAQCGGRRPSASEWTRRFASLHRLFPNAQLGFGEVGMPHPASSLTRAAAASLIGHYYRLEIDLPYYVGGGFYWSFAEDMVPWRSSPLWSVLARAWSEGPVGRVSDSVMRAEPSPPPPRAAFSYQLGGSFHPAAGVGVVDRDWHAAPAAGAYNICYVNAFQVQPEELGWWRSHHPALLLHGRGGPVIDTSWKEQLLDTSTLAKRRALAGIVGGWMDRCARVGYRAVEPDNLDSWTRSRGALTAADNVALARLLILRAHAAGLAIAQKNAAELAETGRRAGFDFAIAEECQALAECGSYLHAYGDRTIEIEYPDDGGVRNFERACALRGDHISIILRDRNVTPAGQPGFIERRCR